MQNKEKVSIIRLLADCREKIIKLEKENAKLKAENFELKEELRIIKENEILDFYLESELRERNE